MIGGYLFEKAAYVCAGLARIAECLKGLGVGTAVHQEIKAHLDVAAWHALRLISLVTGRPGAPDWPRRLVNECSPFWNQLQRTLSTCR